MYLAEQSNHKLVLEGDRLPGWAVGAYFGGIFVAVLVMSVSGGGGIRAAVFGLLCGVPLLILIPLAAFATSSYPRLEVEPGRGVRRYEVYRLTGPRLSFEIPWDRIDRLDAEPQIRPVGQRRVPHHALRLTAETGGQAVVLGRYDGGTDRTSLDEPLRVLRHYFGGRLAVVKAG